jgi:MFS family permease
MSTPIVAPAPTPSTGRTARSGTVGAALRHRHFRTMWLGSFGSNIGTWMQTLVLPAYIDQRTESGLWVGLFVFGQLGPLLLLSIPGGVLADKFPRKQWMMSMQAEQLVLTLVLAALVSADATLLLLFLAQLGIGIGNALNAPAFQGTMPNLVPKEDLPGAISLNSVMINGSRVIGPTIAAVLMSRGVGAPAILVINAVTYLFVIYAIFRIRIPKVGSATDEKGWANFMTGLRIARERTVLGRLILGMALFSFLCLPFVGLFPTIARLNFGPRRRAPRPTSGSMHLGVRRLPRCALDRHRPRTARQARLILPLFSGSPCASPPSVCSARTSRPSRFGFALGFFYFALGHVDADDPAAEPAQLRARTVMSLWFMAFGGTGRDRQPGIRARDRRDRRSSVILFGAACAVGLAWWCDVSRRQVSVLVEGEAVAVDEPRHEALQPRRRLALTRTASSPESDPSAASGSSPALP